MRYIVGEKTQGHNYCLLGLDAAPATLGYKCALYVEQIDFDALSVGQEITVDVVPVPKESV
jgi:hypothetical protein